MGFTSILTRCLSYGSIHAHFDPWGAKPSLLAVYGFIICYANSKVLDPPSDTNVDDQQFLKVFCQIWCWRLELASDLQWGSVFHGQGWLLSSFFTCCHLLHLLSSFFTCTDFDSRILSSFHLRQLWQQTNRLPHQSPTHNLTLTQTHLPTRLSVTRINSQRCQIRAVRCCQMLSDVVSTWAAPPWARRSGCWRSRRRAERCPSVSQWLNVLEHLLPPPLLHAGRHGTLPPRLSKRARERWRCRCPLQLISSFPPPSPADPTRLPQAGARLPTNIQTQQYSDQPIFKPTNIQAHQCLITPIYNITNIHTHKYTNQSYSNLQIF